MAPFFLILALVGRWEGRVVDAKSNQPIPYVQVEILNLNLVVFSDTNGRFVVSSEDLPAVVNIRAERIGYQAREWTGVGTEKPVVLYLLPKAIPIFGITSTATRLVQTPAPAMPVTKIERTWAGFDGVSDVGEALVGSPGVLIQDYGNLRTVSLRGATVEQTLVMLDGVRLNSSLNNQVDLTTFSPFLAERIEVVRGGASALYGANTIGGVINIITPEAKARALDVNLGLASFETKFAGLNVVYPGMLNFLFRGSYFHSGNRFPYYDLNDSLQRLKNGDLTRAEMLVKVGRGFGMHHLSFAGSLTGAERGSPGPLTFPSDSARLKDSRLIFIAGYDLQTSELSNLAVRLHHQRQFQHYYNPSEYFSANDTHQVFTSGLNLVKRLGIFRDWIGLNLVFGVEGNAEQVNSTKVGAPSRKTGAGFLELGLDWSGFNFSPALRYEIIRNHSGSVFSNYGALSYRGTLAFRKISPLSFYIGAHRSFRTPTFNELFWPDEQWVKGNPHLKPEWGWGVDGGLAIKADRGGFRFGGFYNDVQDMIQWQMGEGFVFQPVNVDRAKIVGFEFEPDFDFGFGGFSGGVTYQLCRSDSFLVPYRPKLFGRVTGFLRYRNKGDEFARLTLGVVGVGERFTNIYNTDTLPGYVTFDVGTTIRIPVRFLRAVLSGGCRNIFDRRYQVVKDYPVPGRSFYLETEIGI